MSVNAKSGTAWPVLSDGYVKKAGVWTPIDEIFVNTGGAWVSVFKAEVVVTLSATSASVNLRSLFDAATWADTKRKRVVIPSGVTIGANNWAGALYIGAGTQWGGDLIVDNYGTVAGIGGVSWSNGGEGGSGISCAITGLLGQRLTVNNYGNLYGGGGAGGQGGQGGGGVYQYVASNQEWPGLSWGCYWMTGVPGDCPVGWMFNTVANAGDPNSTAVWGNDGALYLRGSLVQAANENDAYTYYAVSRQTFANAYTSGGAGGLGGRGQGSDGGAAGGAGGGSPGTNAGWGGAGGTGGSWGTQGATGAAGGGGNNGGGSGGYAGGLGGKYASGYLTLNNTGVILGRSALS